jgi:hypothetical protein
VSATQHDSRAVPGLVADDEPDSMWVGTERDIEVQDGSGIDLELADQGAGDLAEPRKNAITERGHQTVEKYLGDLREARAIASDPPALGEVLTRLWHSPAVLADHWLLRWAIRLLYFPVAFPVIALCYFLVSSFVHPARGTLLAALLVLGGWLWFVA